MERTFSLKALLGVTTIVALFFAPDGLTPVLATAGALLIGFGLLAAIFRRGEVQAYWIGFSLFALVYLWTTQNNFGQLNVVSSIMRGDSRNATTIHWGSYVQTVSALHVQLICCLVVALLGGRIGRAQYRKQAAQSGKSG